MIVKGGVPIRRIPKASSVSIQAGQRVFHKRADGSYDPASITLRAEVKNVNNPKYAWGRIVNGIFQSNGVIYNTLVVNPAYTGVIAVRVRGDNIPNYIEEYTSISVVDDGQPGTHYEIVFTQDNLVVDSIACTSDNYPKISQSVLATLYKIEGNKKQECANYYSRFIAYGWNNEIMRDIIGDTQNSYVEFAADSDDEMYFNVQFREKNGAVVAEKGIARVSDGDNGKPGQNGIPGCAIRRSEWKAGIEYRNDEAMSVVTRYLDIAMVRAKNSIGWRGYKCLQTHVSAESNKPGNATYWEELPTNTVGILASLIIARDAKLDFLSGNEIRILDANDRVTAGVSGSGSGETGIRFYAGSDDPQNAPFRVDENGKVIADNGEFRGKVETAINGNKIVIDPENSTLRMTSSDGDDLCIMEFDNPYPQHKYSKITLKSIDMMYAGRRYEQTIILKDSGIDITRRDTLNNNHLNHVYLGTNIISISEREAGGVNESCDIRPHGITLMRDGKFYKSFE